MKRFTKRNITTNTFETLAEVGKNTTEGTVKDIVSSADILNLLYGKTETSTTQKPQQETKIDTDLKKIETRLKEASQQQDNHTPIDVVSLQKKHAELSQEKTDLDRLRKKLFEHVKEEESHAIREIAEEKHQKEQKELSEEQQKQDNMKRRLLTYGDSEAPSGKVQRGGLFAKKKKQVKQSITEQQMEQRGSGKH